MAVVLLARHGETDWNAENRFQGHADRPLTERGRAQADALAARLADVTLAAVYASDLRRARETAERVAARHRLPVHARPALREVDVGSWTGLSTAEARDRFPDAFRRWHEHGRAAWEDGETYEQMRDRALTAVFQIAAAHSGSVALAVTHGGTIRALLATAAGMDLGDYRRVRPAQPNAGLAALALSAGRLEALAAESVLGVSTPSRDA